MNLSYQLKPSMVRNNDNLIRTEYKQSDFCLIKRFAILLLTSFLIAGNLFAQRSDKKKSEVGAFSGGVVYSLPRTGIRIIAEVSQEKFFRGPYSEFALKYLGV